MEIRRMGIGIVAIALVGAGIAGSPKCAIAQGNPPASDNTGSQIDPANKKIDLDLESSNLYYGLKLLFGQVKANFTIDESLKSLTVTAHLSQVPFRVALETLLKSTSTPLTYKVDNGIYSVVPKVETPGGDPIPDGPLIPDGGLKDGGWKYGMIRPNNLSALDIVLAFGGSVVNVGYHPSSFGQGGLGGGIGGGIGGGVGGGLGQGSGLGSGFGGNGSSGLGGSNGGGGLNGGSGRGYGNSGSTGGNGRGGF